MDTQQERSRMDEGNLQDSNTDVTRDQNRQKAGEANEGRNVSNDPTRAGEGHEGREETGSHREGNYDKNRSNPLQDNEKD